MLLNKRRKLVYYRISVVCCLNDLRCFDSVMLPENSVFACIATAIFDHSKLIGATSLFNEPNTMSHVISNFLEFGNLRIPKSSEVLFCGLGISQARYEDQHFMLRA